MSKDKEKKTNAMRMVERAKVPYNVYHYAWKEDALDAVHAAAELQRPTDQVFKTLVAIGDKTGPVVGVIPSDQELDLKKFARASGNKRVEMLHLKDLEKTTGYIRGGCSPIGMKKLFPTIFHESCLSFDTILVSGGKSGTQVELSPSDLLRLTKGKTASVAH